MPQPQLSYLSVTGGSRATGVSQGGRGITELLTDKPKVVLSHHPSASPTLMVTRHVVLRKDKYRTYTHTSINKSLSK